MPRSGERARSLLQQAALNLYRERGFDRTTSAEIATRAGVTERTFFRHFADKREVLFEGEVVLRDRLVQSVAEAPDVHEPLQTLLRAFRSAVPLLLDNRPFSEPRHHIINATPALYERELAKLHSLGDSLATALRKRGVPEAPAVLAARIAVATFELAFNSWIHDPTPGLDAHLVAAFHEIHTLASPITQ